jgi:hypothetical protein
VGDDRRREPMALVTDGQKGHAGSSTRIAATPELT